MARLPRLIVPHQPHHVIQQGNDRQLIFREPEDYARFVGWLKESAREFKVAIHAYVFMTNHVHVLAAFRDEEAMLTQCESWKHFTATKINRVLRRKGRFWQQDGFDHLVRSLDQFLHFRRYIAENPQRAHLHDGEFLHFSKAL